jgi:anti-sigma regulatory factor (Ser/Thr protein kinase)
MNEITDSELKEGIILKRQLTLPNDIKTIPRLSEFIEGIGEELDMDMSLIMSLNLALEEAVVNVMEYAYAPGTQGDVCIKTTANETQIEFIIIDSGIPFDPTKKEEVEPALKKALDLYKQNIPVVLNCIIPEDDKVFPMSSPGAPLTKTFDASDLQE